MCRIYIALPRPGLWRRVFWLNLSAFKMKILPPSSRCKWLFSSSSTRPWIVDTSGSAVRELQYKISPWIFIWEHDVTFRETVISTLFTFVIWSFFAGDYEDWPHLGCKAVWFGRYIATFQTASVVRKHKSSVCILTACCGGCVAEFVVVGIWASFLWLQLFMISYK